MESEMGEMLKNIRALKDRNSKIKNYISQNTLKIYFLNRRKNVMK